MSKPFALRMLGLSLLVVLALGIVPVVAAQGGGDRLQVCTVDCEPDQIRLKLQECVLLADDLDPLQLQDCLLLQDQVQLQDCSGECEPDQIRQQLHTQDCQTAIVPLQTRQYMRTRINH